MRRNTEEEAEVEVIDFMIRHPSEEEAEEEVVNRILKRYRKVEKLKRKKEWRQR